MSVPPDECAYQRRARTRSSITTSVNRRTFLELLGAGTAWAASGVAFFKLVGPANTSPPAAPRRDGIVALGRAYLRRHPRESDAAFLRQRLPALDPIASVRSQLPTVAPSAMQDFIDDATVGVDGWVLGRTEARAAAAVALGA